MPGGQGATFRPGNRAELLAQLLLSGLAFTSPVPRQEDFGVDFFCSLITSKAKLLKAGPFFTVQAKSSRKPIIYKEPHAVEWITTQENPFFVCVAHRAELAIDIYSTWNLACGTLAGGTPNRLILQPGTPPPNFPGVVRDEATKTDTVALGDPILRVTEADLSNEEKRQKIGAILGWWVAMDRANIVNRQAGIFWVTGPLAYTTGELPEVIPMGIALYWHPQNIPNYVGILGRTAAALTLIFRDDRIDEAIRTAPRVEVLRSLISAYWDGFDEPTKILLNMQGLNPHQGT